MRLQRTTDYRMVNALETLLFPDSKEDDAETPRRGNVYWALWHEGEMVGYCSVRPSQTEKNAAFLSRAGLLPSARGRGLQRRMVRVRERWAKDNGFERTITYVHTTNIPSLRNIMACGYLPYEPYWHDDLGCGYVCFEKWL